MAEYYERLGVQPDVSAQDLQRAYRELAMKWHPDRNPSPESEEQMKAINEAYEVLSDTEMRQEYDLFENTDHGRLSDDFDFSDLFKSSSPTPEARPPADTKGDPGMYKLSLGLQDYRMQDWTADEDDREREFDVILYEMITAGSGNDVRNGKVTEEGDYDGETGGEVKWRTTNLYAKEPRDQEGIEEYDEPTVEVKEVTLSPEEAREIAGETPAEGSKFYEVRAKFTTNYWKTDPHVPGPSEGTRTQMFNEMLDKLLPYDQIEYDMVVGETQHRHDERAGFWSIESYLYFPDPKDQRMAQYVMGVPQQ